MNDFVRTKLEELKADYCDVKGEPFSHFYCPILFMDENTPLCEAHIINQAFNDSARTTTVQRADVDSFYGSRFESDFLDVQNYKERSMAEIVTDKALSKRFGSKILLEDKPVDFFFGSGEIPPQFTPINLEKVKLTVPFGLKMHPTEVIAAQDKRWEIEIQRDVRIPMLVSVIKAAHLTLFEILGYRYALSASGVFVGHDILGKFFLQNQKKRKTQVVKNAVPYFREFANMVRPIISCPFDSKGTVTDKTFLVCVGSSGLAWAFIVFVKTGHLIHGVLMPVFEQVDQSVTYLDFLRNQNSWLQVATCWFKGDKWEITKNTVPLNWPKAGLLYPQEGNEGRNENGGPRRR